MSEKKDFRNREAEEEEETQTLLFGCPFSRTPHRTQKRFLHIEHCRADCSSTNFVF